MRVIAYRAHLASQSTEKIEYSIARCSRSFFVPPWMCTRQPSRGFFETLKRDTILPPRKSWGEQKSDGASVVADAPSVRGIPKTFHSNLSSTFQAKRRTEQNELRNDPLQQQHSRALYPRRARGSLTVL